MSDSTGELPRLVVLFDAMVQSMKLLEASAGEWQTVWMIDRADPGVAEWARPLRRFGQVIDATGLCPDQVTAAVAEHRPAGIIAFADRGLPLAATVGTRLGLPAYSPETAERLVNKVAQREALRAAGIPVPDFRPLPAGTTARELWDIGRSLRYPVLVKPQVGAGSRGVYRVSDTEELLRVVGGGAALRSDLIVEELLADEWPRDQRPDADVVSVESIIAHGELSHLAVTGRAAHAEPFRETGAFVPSTFPPGSVDAILSTADQAVRAMETHTGVFHTEVKMTPGGPRVIEVNGRVGGHLAQILEMATGESTYSIAGRVALGQSLRFDGLLPCARVGYTMLVVPTLDATRLTRLAGLADVHKIRGVHSMDIGRSAGDGLDWREGFEGRILTVYGEAPNHEAMWTARQQVLDTIDIDYERTADVG